jgi:hypothetical protein
MSLRDVYEIIREYYPEKRKLSPRTMALDLFAKGKTILEVIKTLDMPFEEAKIVEEQYLEIQDRGELAELYHKYENKHRVVSIMKLSDLLEEKNLGIKDLDDVITYCQKVPELQKLFNLLNFEVSRQKLMKSGLESEISELNLTKKRLSTNLYQMKSQFFSMQHHNDELSTYELQLKAKITNQINLVQMGENKIRMGENKIRQIIQTQFDKIFDKYDPMLYISFFIVIDYIRKSDDKELLKYLFEGDNAKSQNTEYLRYNDKIDQMVKEIRLSFKTELFKIAENNVINHQQEPLSRDKENTGISA